MAVAITANAIFKQINMAEQIKQITVNGNKVGIIGLTKIFQKIHKTNPDQSAINADEFLELARLEQNCIPAGAEESYKQALIREFQSWLTGKSAMAESGSLQIKILGQGCINCLKLVEETMNALAELNVIADVEHITDIKEFAQYGVIGVPAWIINRKVKSIGRVPQKEQIKKWIQEEINRNED